MGIGLLMTALALLSIYLWHKRLFWPKVLSIGATVLLPLVLALNIVGAYDHHSIAPLIQKIETKLTPNTQLATYSTYYQDLPLYTAQRIWIFYNWNAPGLMQDDNWARELALGYQHHLAHYPWLMLPKQLLSKWHSNHNLVVFAPQNTLPLLQKTLNPKPADVSCVHKICALIKQ